MAGLNAGDLDREITLQTATAAQSDSGEESFDWEHPEEETIWAQWLPGGTRETWQAQQRLASYIEGVFRIYERDRPNPDDTRILFEGRLYDIKPSFEDMKYDNALLIPVVARGEAV